MFTTFFSRLSKVWNKNIQKYIICFNKTAKKKIHVNSNLIHGDGITGFILHFYTAVHLYTYLFTHISKT